MNIEARNDIINYARANDFEVCGFICCDLLGKIVIVKCNNIHPEKKHNFRIDPQDYLAAKSKYTLLSIFHSHVSHSIRFSDNDKELSEELMLPVYLINTNYNIFREYLPQTLNIKLTERNFIWGISDCYSLVRYYYWQNFKIYLTDYDRAEGLLSSDFILDVKEKEHFIFIDQNAVPRDHDVLLYKNYRNLPHHLGVYSKGKIYEHKQNRLSEYRNPDFSDVKNRIGLLRHVSLV